VQCRIYTQYTVKMQLFACTDYYSVHKCLNVDISKGGHEEHTVTPVQHTAMAGNKRSEVFPIASSLESAAEEAGHGSEGAGKEADGSAVDKEGGGGAKVEGGQIRREWNRGETGRWTEEGRLGL